MKKLKEITDCKEFAIYENDIFTINLNNYFLLNFIHAVTVRVTNGQPSVLSILHANMIQVAIEALLTLKQKKHRESISSDSNSDNNNNDNNNNNNNNNHNFSDSPFYDNKHISRENLLTSSKFVPSDVYSLSAELQEVS